LSAIVAGSALLALVLPQAAFWVIRERIWAAYRTSTVHLGWGIWMHLGAWLAAIVVSGLAGLSWAASRRRTACRPND
jgi:hypothetical protein